MAMDHETIGRKCLPIFGWISVVEGYIVLFGGTLTCLLLGIIYFAQSLPALASGILFGGVPGSFIEGLASIAVGDLMIRFDDKADVRGVMQDLKKKESSPKPQAEPSPVKPAKPVEPTKPVEPAKPVEPTEPVVYPHNPSTSFERGAQVSYQGKKGTITFISEASQSAAVKFTDQSVEVIPLKSLTLL